MRPMALLFLALFNSILGLSVLFPVLAPLGLELGLRPFEITTLSTAYALMQLVMSRFWGRRSDAKGRVSTLLIGISGFALSFFAFGAVAWLGQRGALTHWPLYAGLLGTRLLGGALSSATIPTAQAYAADITGPEDRTKAMAVIGAAFGSGIVFGPAIGAGLAALTGSLLAPVFFSASIAVVNGLFVWLALPEPERHTPDEEAVPRESRDVWRTIWPILAVGLAATLSSVAMEQTVALYFQARLELEEIETAKAVGLALVGYGVIAVITQGFLVRRVTWKPATLVRLGVPIALAGFVLFVLADSCAMLTAALCVQGLGQGLVLPGVTAALSLSVGPDEQGAVAGWNGSSQGLGRTLGPVVGGAFFELSPELPYVFSGCLLLLVLAVVWLRPLGAARGLLDA